MRGSSSGPAENDPRLRVACRSWQVTFRWPCSLPGMGGTLLEVISSRTFERVMGNHVSPTLSSWARWSQDVSLNLWPHKQTRAARTETTKLRVMGEQPGMENAVQSLSCESGRDGFGLGLGPFRSVLCSPYNGEDGWMCLHPAWQDGVFIAQGKCFIGEA